MLNSSKYSIPKVQRALVFQGGGALGAYQAGVFKALYEKIKRTQSDDNSDKTAPLFDIIAGTSIGAVNGAILVSYFLENKKFSVAALYIHDRNKDNCLGVAGRWREVIRTPVRS